MSLVCLTILGNRNEPIYSCENPFPTTTTKNDDEKKEEDVFGFYESQTNNKNLNIRHEVSYVFFWFSL